ncbi:MBL fold metallo-hydrolase [Bradyrhizobium sp. HKCCYLS1011]|uniref:MBL fold metallo-hydrolase n=1 Tax=Bradyrhizobium sp. HKCCYLS1011 TaxID=3420733 RepID=UPI003EB81CFF
MTSTFSVGDFTIRRIVEQEIPFFAAREMFPNLTPEMLDENREGLKQAGAIDDRDTFILCFQSYVVKTPHHTILIDSCIGNDKRLPRYPTWNMKSDDSYARALAAAGVGVADIDIVMCSHLHADHVGWNTKADNGRWVPTFPNARYVFGKREYDHWTAQNEAAEVPPFVESVLPVVEAGRADLVRDDFAIGDHVRIVPTPGHTPGHIAIAIGKGRDDALFAGDLIHSPLQLRYPELSPRFDVDPVESAATRRRFLERCCDSDALCCPAHFPSPSISRIRRKGTGFTCEWV